MEARSTGLRVSSGPSLEFLFNYTQISLFLKSHHLGKGSHLIFLYIIGYNNISWRPHNLHSKIWGSGPHTLNSYRVLRPHSPPLSSPDGLASASELIHLPYP